MKNGGWLGILALASVGCSDGEGPDTNAQAELAAECRAPCKAPQLDERFFLLESARGFEPLSGTTVRVVFDDGSLDVGAGCNSLGGEFSLKDGQLVLGESGSTQIGCDPARLAQDEWVWAFFRSSPKIALAGSALTLTGANAELVFRDREVADPDRPLVATLWTIDTFLSNGGAGSFGDPVAPTLSFGADGKLKFDTSCNTGGATYTVSGDQLTLSMVGATDAFCSGASGAAEAHILRVLVGNGPLDFEIQAGRLTLTRGSVGISATAP